MEKLTPKIFQLLQDILLADHFCPPTTFFLFPYLATVIFWQKIGYRSRLTQNLNVFS